MEKQISDQIVARAEEMDKENRRLQDKYLDSKFKSNDEAHASIQKGLDDAREDRKDLFKAMEVIGRDVSALKVKAGIWGGLSGAISTSIVLGLAWIKSIKP